MLNDLYNRFVTCHVSFVEILGNTVGNLVYGSARAVQGFPL